MDYKLVLVDHSKQRKRNIETVTFLIRDKLVIEAMADTS